MSGDLRSSSATRSSGSAASPPDSAGASGWAARPAAAAFTTSDWNAGPREPVGGAWRRAVRRWPTFLKTECHAARGPVDLLSAGFYRAETAPADKRGGRLSMSPINPRFT